VVTGPPRRHPMQVREPRTGALGTQGVHLRCHHQAGTSTPAWTKTLPYTRRTMCPPTRVTSPPSPHLVRPWVVRWTAAAWAHRLALRLEPSVVGKRRKPIAARHRLVRSTRKGQNTSANLVTTGRAGRSGVHVASQSSHPPTDLASPGHHTSHIVKDDVGNGCRSVPQESGRHSRLATVITHFFTIRTEEKENAPMTTKQGNREDRKGADGSQGERECGGTACASALHV